MPQHVLNHNKAAEKSAKRTERANKKVQRRLKKGKSAQKPKK
jgi:hypothetical protein